MKKFIHATMTFGMCASAAFAVVPKKGLVQETPGSRYLSSAPYQAASANFTSILSTGFEAPDWDLGHSVCGDEFAWGAVPGPGVVCTYPTPASNPCLFKNHAANFNCCPSDAHDPLKGDPNEETGWSMSPSSRHCRQPSIVDIGPFAGTQHLRFQYDPLGGIPVGGSGFGSATRTRAISSQTAVAEISRSNWSMEIKWDATLGSSMVLFIGQDTSVGSAFELVTSNWSSLGSIDVTVPQGGSPVLIGYWGSAANLGQYRNFTADFNPCTDTITYSYAGAAVLTVPMGFTPPFGNAGTDLSPAIGDTAFYTQDHRPGSIMDMDEHIVTYTPCTDSCCDGATGTCTDDVAAVDCAGPFQHHYLNVLCSKLGTDPKYPPACNRDTGSCCDRSPLAGGAGPEGACTEGVLEENCAGAQQTWTHNAACAPTNAACNIGLGQCDASGFCNWGHGKVGADCTTNSDCNVAGFCYAGTCQGGLPGHCEYASLGFCEAMGRCSGSAACVPSTGAGCCDPTCGTPVNCPGAETCVAEPQQCNVVPSGADCAFCEGCDAWPTVDCSDDSQCPSPGIGIPAGTCEPDPVFGCNSAADCGAAEICIISAASTGGALCTADADCAIPVATCLEDTGSCCNTLEGTCTDDVLFGDCSGAQRSWIKNGDCATAGCSAVLGACCDADPFGSCTDTTSADCTCDKCTWTKLGSCFGPGAIECTHNSIPTVSSWGLVVLTLLLLVGAKVYFGRREVVA